MNQQFVIIWGGLAISQVVYLFVPAPPPEGGAGLPAVFPIALGAVAIVQSIGIVMLLRIRAFDPVRSGRLDPASKDGVAHLFTTLIMAWVLAESIAIYGLVLRFLHFELAYTLPFTLAGAYLLFLARPWSSKLRKPPSTASLASSSSPLK